MMGWGREVPHSGVTEKHPEWPGPPRAVGIQGSGATVPRFEEGTGEVTPGETRDEKGSAQDTAVPSWQGRDTPVSPQQGDVPVHRLGQTHGG